MGRQYIGIEIGGTKLQLFLGGEAGQVQERARFAIDPSEGALGIRRQLEQALSVFRAHGAAAAGVGFGGPVDWATGQICCSHQIPGWSEFPLRQWIAERLGLPVTVDNDANVAALGEAVHGAGAGKNPVFYVTLGSGVGGGLVLDGKIYHGAKPGESEIGHLRLDRAGTILESRCSGWAVDARIRTAIGQCPESILARLCANSSRGEARFLKPALEQNDPLAGQILDQTAEDLAFGLSHVVHLFHPQIIVLGGGLSLVGEPLRAAVATRMPDFMMNAFHPGPSIALAQLGEDAVPVGALELARRHSVALC